MPSQQYRGHVIDVVCLPRDGCIGYRTTIRSDATGEVRHREECVDAVFASEAEAADQAFRNARVWIERSPLHWPFPLPGGSS